MDVDGQDLKTIVELLRRRGALILLVAVLVLGVAGLTVLAIRPVYSATALVLVDPSKKNLLDPTAQASGSSSDSVRVDSEVELVKSETTLLAVAEELGLASDPEFGPRLGPLDMLANLLRLAGPVDGRESRAAMLNKLRDSVTAQRRGLTFLIAVSARSERSEFAATIANAVARTYIAQQLAAKTASTLASAELVKQRVAEATATLAQSERALDAFIDRNVARIAGATGRADLAQLRGEIAALEQARAQSSATVERIGSSLARRDWADVAANLEGEAVAYLARHRLQLLGEVAETAEASAAAVDLRASLAAVEGRLQGAAASSLASLEQEVAAAQNRLSDLRTQLRGSFLQSDLPPEVLAGIYQLQQTSEIARTQYLALLTRQNDLDTQVYLQVADSRLVAEATPPDVPSFPRPDLVLLLAGLVGLGAGIAVAFLVEHFVGGLTSAAQLQSVLKSPLVAVVPRQRPPKATEGVTPTLVDSLVLSPLSAFPEAIRRIRLGLEQAIRGRPRDADTGAVIMVTSATPGEGKTTIALSLARAYALAGMSTLLIDCDLRNPGIHKLLGIEPSEGLFEYLALSTDASALKSILALDQASGARIVVGSRRSDIATDQLVAGKTFARLIAAARANFDIVVLDTPPVGPVVDGLYLAGLTDAIAFVVKFSSTPQQEVRTAMASLLSARTDGVPILTILNQQTTDLAAYRGKYAGYYAEA